MSAPTLPAVATDPEATTRKVEQIAALLPGIFRRTRTRHEADPLEALLGVMAQFQVPVETELEALHTFFDPQQAPLNFLRFLAYWVDLEPLVALYLPAELGSPLAKDAGRPPLSRLRTLIVAAAPLLQQRGTNQGLQRFLEICTGVPGFAVIESPDYPFHVAVRYPAGAAGYTDFIRHVIEYQKPAYLTYDLAAAS